MNEKIESRRVTILILTLGSLFCFTFTIGGILGVNFLSTKQFNVSLPQVEKEENLTKVTKFIDGDTLELESIGKVRLIGVDTPEIVDPRKPVECFAREASNKIKELLKDHTVYYQYDASQGNEDKFGRQLIYLFRDDGLFINQELIAEGYAYEYTYSKPYQYQLEFKTAELSAQADNQGLWAQNSCGGKR